MKKYIVYSDMDGVLADFNKPLKEIIEDPPEMFEVGFFRNLPLMPGAKEAIEQILQMEHVDLYIASKPTTKNLHSTIEKYQWITEHFPALQKKIFLICDKHHLNGDFLIDDDLRWKAFPGKFVHFKGDWPSVVEMLENLKT